MFRRVLLGFFVVRGEKTSVGFVARSRQFMSGRVVTIVVSDKATRDTTSFTCEESVLRREMKYFSSVLDDLGAASAPTIYANCDVGVFSWLMEYVRGEAPILTAEMSVSVLLSSHFLQMDRLVLDATAIFWDRAADIVLSDVRLSCLGREVCRKLLHVATIDHHAALAVALHGKRVPHVENRQFVTEQLWSFVNRGDILSALSWCRRCGQLVRRDSADCPCPSATSDGTPVPHSLSQMVVAFVEPTCTWSDKEKLCWRILGAVCVAVCPVCGVVVPATDWSSHMRICNSLPSEWHGATTAVLATFCRVFSQLETIVNVGAIDGNESDVKKFAWNAAVARTVFGTPGISPIDLIHEFETKALRQIKADACPPPAPIPSVKPTAPGGDSAAVKKKRRPMRTFV